MGYYVAAKSFDMGVEKNTGRSRAYEPGDYVPEASADGFDPKPWVARGYIAPKEGVPPTVQTGTKASAPATPVTTPEPTTAPAGAPKKARAKKAPAAKKAAKKSATA